MRYTTFFIVLTCWAFHLNAQSDKLIFKNAKYAWYANRIEQCRYIGKAMSPLHLSWEFGHGM